jgi:hypothetical protein
MVVDVLDWLFPCFFWRFAVACWLGLLACSRVGFLLLRVGCSLLSLLYYCVVILVRSFWQLHLCVFFHTII